MALEKGDLKAIKQIVKETVNEVVVREVDARVTKTETYLKDYVEFAIEKSEIRIDHKLDKMGKDIKDIKQDLSDIAETNRYFINVFGDHEERIKKVEKKLKIVSV